MVNNADDMLNAVGYKTDKEVKIIKKVPQEELLNEAKEFFESHKRKIGKNIRLGDNAIVIDFDELAEHSIKMADDLISKPEETIQLLEVAAEEIDWLPNNVRIRLSSLSHSQDINIRNIRAKNAGKMISFDGVIRQASLIRSQVTNIKYECPSCLPIGTKVMTPDGLKNIEDVEIVHSVDENFNIIDKKVNVIKTGKKKIWEISTVYKRLYSSKDHKWIVYRDGMTMVIQTKDIKNGDIIYGVDNNEVQSMWSEDTERINKEEKKNVQLELQKDSRFISSEEWRKDEDRRKENDKTVPKWSFDGAYCDNIIYESQANKEKVNKIWNYNENIERTMYNICEKFKYIQAWKKMWGKGIQTYSERELQVGMQQMWRNKEQNEGSFGTSQGWKSFKQFSNEFRSSMRFVPYKVTSLRETEEEVEMYDLQVPGTNNFILEGGIITHNCGTIISVLQVEKEQKQPSRCSCGRRGGFKNIAEDTIDSQIIVVEESPDNLEDGGDQPKRMKVWLKEDLTEEHFTKKIAPGNKVKVIGVLHNVKMGANSNKPLVTYDYAIEANNIIQLEEDFEDTELTEEEEEEILEISKREDLVDYLSSSVAPSVYGNKEIKKALVLQLFGGVSRIRSDGSNSREQIHGLLVGDPGVAKSVILKYMQEITRKSRFISGKGASGVGMTASIVKDEISGGFALEAGAMVLANNGALFIDEFEKMSEEDRSNLHEGMSLGTVTISKATVQATLNAKTSILAAANPKHGRFDASKSLVSQINLMPSLLSRFDFIFVMRDIPGKERDSLIADKIFSEHNDDRDDHDVLEKSLFKKYISYAKQLHPKLGDGAIRTLKDYYVGLRDRVKMIDGKPAIPLGARQLEGLIRFSEAAAKMRLSRLVTIRDAEYAIKIMESYLMEIGYDKENKTFDVDMISGNGAKSRSKLQIIKDAIRLVGIEFNGMAPIDKVKTNLDTQYSSIDVEDAIEKLIKGGDIFRPQRGFVRLM